MRIVTWNILEHTAIGYLTLDTPVSCQSSICKPGLDHADVLEKNYRDRYGQIISLINAKLARDNVEMICLQEAHYNFYTLLKKNQNLVNQYHVFHDARANLLTLIHRHKFKSVLDMGREVCPIDIPVEIKVQAYYLESGETYKGFYVVNTHLPGKPGIQGDSQRVKIVNRILDSLKICHERKRTGIPFSLLMVGDMNQPGAVDLFTRRVSQIRSNKLKIYPMNLTIDTSFHRFELIGGRLSQNNAVWRQKKYKERYSQIDHLIHSTDWDLTGPSEVLPAGGMYGYETPYKVDDEVALMLYLDKPQASFFGKPKFADNFDLSRGAKTWLSDHAMIKYSLERKRTLKATAPEYKPL